MDEKNEELFMTEVDAAKKSERKKRKKKGVFSKIKDAAPKDFWDYIIIEVGVASAIMLVLLAVNVFANFGDGSLMDVFSRFTATLSNVVV